MRVLLFEPNPYHYEVIPGFAYYLIRLGYEVDCLIQEPGQDGDVFYLCPSIKKKIRLFYYHDGKHRQHIESLQKENVYDLLFATSFDKKKKDGWEDLFRELLSYDQSRLGVIGCYHSLKTYLENRKNGPLPTQRVVSLSPVDSGEGFFREANANYYSDTILGRPKNRNTRITQVCVTGNEPVHLQHTQHVFHVTQKKPQSPLTLDWIKMWYIHTTEYFSAIKKNEIMK